MRNKDIKSLAELHLEVAKLKNECRVREIQLKEDAKAYIKQFSPLNLIKGFLNPRGLSKLDEETNLSGRIMSFVLPLLLNKTLFRGSGFITKGIASLISGKIGKSLDIDSLTGMFHKVKSVFASKKNKNDAAFIDYGIPPDSETY